MNHSRKRAAETLREAHVALQDDLRKLEDAANSRSEKCLGELCARLSVTHALITAHFHFEEQDGYMEAVRNRQPRLEHVVQKLEGEHRDLVQSLEALIAQVNVATSLTDQLREKVRAWVQRFRQHEACENDIVQDAFGLDLGTKD